jgi:glycosyltransferase involved in cell wall biosynthesis
MKIVHLLANWKWTGPAEPAANLVLALRARGHEVWFLSGRPPRGRRNWVAEAAARRGLAITGGLALRKHWSPLDTYRDARRLRGLLAEWKPDLIHCHTRNDHVVAAAAAGSLPIVRTVYDGAMVRGRRERTNLARRTAFLACASEAVRKEVVARGLLPEARTATVEAAVDLARFDPGRSLPDLRGEFRIEPGDFVLGIVARIQPRRRFDVFFDALDRTAAEVPHLRVLVVGRGTHMERVAVERAKQGVLGDRIVFAGYRTGDEYVATLGLLHAKVFLWPGSDGSCRAVREAMAMGVPVIAARVGMLPEIVTDGSDGLLVPHDPEALSFAVRRLALGAGERDELAAAARATALRRFDLAAQAARVESIYREVLAAPRP